MSATEAQVGYGTLLKMGNGASPEVFTTVAEVKEISGFGFTSGLLEATHMESPDRYKEFVADLKDGDTITVRCNLVTGNDTELKAVADAGTRKNFQLNFPGSLPDYTFAAVPIAWHLQGITPNGILEVVTGLKISGSIT